MSTVNPRSFADLARDIGRDAPGSDRPVVCVQGLGFVGAAMAVAVADSRTPEGDPWFDVVGVDLPNAQGRARIDAINAGTFPIACADPKLQRAFAAAYDRRNLIATADARAYGLASVTVVDIPLDVIFDAADGPTVDLGGFREALRTLGATMPAGSLVVVETTVPPGTCEKVAAPAIARALEDRGLPPDSIDLAHSYERVMPGQGYFDSIVSFWRVYAGHTPRAADSCEAFLSRVIDVASYPLTRLGSTTASETGKVLENSYRALNIAFAEEWGRFAEAVGIDLFEVIDAIRRRPTHNNLRQPGFGVGGYCLTKDPLLAGIAARELFERPDLEFPYSSRAVATNRKMPLVTLDAVEALLGGDLRGKRILLLGVSYRQDVGDTRYSPSETFVRAARERGADVVCHDPLVSRWEELDMDLAVALPSPGDAHAVVFAVPHEQYVDLDLAAWLDGAEPLVFDANHVLTDRQRSALRRLGVRAGAIGREG